MSGSAYSALYGAHWLVLARATADRATIERHGRGARSEAAEALRDRRQASVMDPFGDHLTTQARTAFRATWDCELARLQGQEATETWAAAANAWDPMVRPHDAAYCRWRAAQVALKVGQGTLAARLLRRAAAGRPAAHSPGLPSPGRPRTLRRASGPESHIPLLPSVRTKPTTDRRDVRGSSIMPAAVAARGVRPERPTGRNDRVPLLPLDGARRLRRDVDRHPVDLAHLVGDPRRDPLHDVVGQPGPVGGHRVLAGDRT